jgi:hypothetical protein
LMITYRKILGYLFVLVLFALATAAFFGEVINTWVYFAILLLLGGIGAWVAERF